MDFFLRDNIISRHLTLSCPPWHSVPSPSVSAGWNPTKISSAGKKRFHLTAKNSFAGKRDFILWQKIFLSKVAIGYFALAFAWTQLQLLPRRICKHISILVWFGICFKWLNFQGNRKSSDDLQPTGCTSTVRLCISSKVEQWQERCWSGCHWNQMQGSVSAAPLLQLILPNLYNRHCCWSRVKDASKVPAEKNKFHSVTTAQQLEHRIFQHIF